MARSLRRPRKGEGRRRIRNCETSGHELAFVRGVEELTKRGAKVQYRRDAEDLEATHELELRAFLGAFAPPGATEPLYPELDPPRHGFFADPDRVSTMHILRPPAKFSMRTVRREVGL